jgi:hypothetical protein
MKGLITTICLILLAGYAQAAPLYDLMYMPEQGEFLSDSDITMVKSAWKLKNSIGTETSEYDQGSITITEEVSYGFMSDLTLGAGVGFIFGGSNDITGITTTIKTETSNGGLTDPVFFGRYRLFKRADVAFNIDLYSSFSPGIANKKEATVSNDGNAFRGGHELAFKGIIGSEDAGFGWSAELGLKHTTKQSIESAQTNVETHEDDGRTDIDVIGWGQMSFSDDMSLDVGLNFQMVGGYTRTTIASATTQEFDSQTRFGLKTRFNYLLAENMLIQGTAGYDILGDQNITSGAIISTFAEGTSLNVGSSFLFKF